MIQFCYFRLNLGIDTVSCCLLPRMDMDWNLKILGQLFQVLMLCLWKKKIHGSGGGDKCVCVWGVGGGGRGGGGDVHGVCQACSSQNCNLPIWVWLNLIIWPLKDTKTDS